MDLRWVDVRRALVGFAGACIIVVSAPVSARCLPEWVQQDQRFGPAVSLTAASPPSAVDTCRAAHILTEIRAVLASYRDSAVPERAGYEISAPPVDGGAYAIERFGTAQRRFAGLRLPAALLFAPTVKPHTFVLIGTRYVDRADAPADELDTIVPLSVARWARSAPRCLASPASYPWVVEVFPFAHNPAKIWPLH